MAQTPSANVTKKVSWNGMIIFGREFDALKKYYNENRFNHSYCCHRIDHGIQG